MRWQGELGRVLGQVIEQGFTREGKGWGQEVKVRKVKALSLEGQEGEDGNTRCIKSGFCGWKVRGKAGCRYAVISYHKRKGRS